MPEDVSAQRPALRLVRGDATAEEVAALLTVLGAVSGAEGPGDEPEVKVESAWTDRASLTRRTFAPGPGAWRASGWVR